MRRALLILFQVVMALVMFGLAVLTFLQLQGADKVPFALWAARIRLGALLLAGILFTVFAVRNLLQPMLQPPQDADK